MATYNYGPYWGAAVDGRQLYIEIIASSSEAANTWTVRTKVYLYSTAGTTWNANTQIGATINGVTTAWWEGYAAYGPGTHLLADSYLVFSANADGNASTTVYGGLVHGTGSLTVQVNNLTLPQIPRATTPNLGSSSGFVTGTSTTINLPRATSGFTHDVSWSFGSKSGTIATGAGVTTSWNPPHTVLTEIPNAASGQVEITVVTKSGSTVIGTKKTLFTLTAGAGVIPTVSAVSWSDMNTGLSSIGAFVQGLSLVKGTVTAAGVHGSSISSKSLLVGSTTMTEAQVFQPATSGTVTASGSAVDSRGRVGTKAANFTVLPYTPPVLDVTVRRATTAGGTVGDGTFLRLDLTAAVQSLIVGTEKNALKLKVETRPVGGAWTTRNNLTHTALTYNNALIMVTGGGIYPLNQSYEVRVTISDNAGQSATSIKLVGTGGAAFSMAAAGTGHGKIWERGGIDVAGNGYVSGNVYSGGITANDRLTKLSETSNASNLTSGTVPAARLPAASETANGVVERATQAEVNAGTDTSRYVSPKGLRDRDYAPWAMAAGATTVSATPYTTITFPVGRFTQPPVVDVRIASSGSGQVLVPWPGGAPSTTSFSCAAITFAGVWTAAGINWIAVQMTSGSSAG